MKSTFDEGTQFIDKTHGPRRLNVDSLCESDVERSKIIVKKRF